MHTRAYTDTHSCTWPCPCPNSPSIVRGSNGVDQLQLRHPFTLPPSLSPNPPSCVTAGPSFLPPDTEAWGSQDGRMCPDQTHRRDRLTRTRHADRRMLPLLWTLDSVFLPIRSCKENDIIPVLIGQQEGRGRQRAVGGGGREHEGG